MCFVSDLSRNDDKVSATPAKLSKDRYNMLMEDLSILDGYKVSSLTTSGPGSAAVNANYYPSPISLTSEIKSIYSAGAGSHSNSSNNLQVLSAHSTPSSEASNSFVRCEHLMSRLWIVALESVSGLLNCRKLDAFDCKAAHGLANFVSALIDEPIVVVPSKIIESLKMVGIDMTYESVVDLAWKMFEKRRATMIVSLWRDDNRKTINRFDQVSFVHAI